jgi:hypothetical protein
MTAGMVLGAAAALLALAVQMVWRVAPRRPLIAATVLAVLVTAVWAALAVCTVGPTPPLRWSWGWRGLAADYVQDWQVPTGAGWDLYGTVACLYALCLFRRGWHRQREGPRP